MLSGPKIISEVPGPISKLVVFLHGYGASGKDLISLSQAWKNLLPPTAFIAPNGPEQCDVHIFGYQWFGLPDFSPKSMRLGLDRVRPILLEYLKSLLIEYQLSPKDLALVGFSQGTIIALEMLFALPNIGCVLGYSGAFFPPPDKNSLHTLTKVLLIHGTMDMVVPYIALNEAQTKLKSFGVEVEAYTCNGIGHTIDFAGIQIGGNFLSQHLSNQHSSIAL